MNAMDIALAQIAAAGEAQPCRSFAAIAQRAADKLAYRKAAGLPTWRAFNALLGTTNSGLIRDRRAAARRADIVSAARTREALRRSAA